ncbi:hypothetical protein ACTWJ8_40050 (plasmid) [Streptomyces sp. SDT5-1]|uniref:hypothetical protein n=1 Tax=Streptomyces sp. SDT5-1 TaxID=3406418 RepID=UPI003FD4A542
MPAPTIHRLRRVAAWTTVGTVLALLLTALVLVIAAPSVPSPWWPKTGAAFAATPAPPADAAHREMADAAACDAIVGPAHRYCLGAPRADVPVQGRFTAADAWPLAAAAAGLTALHVATRRRGQR